MDWFWECALFQLLRLFGWLYSTFQTEARTVERLTIVILSIILSKFDNVRKGHFLVHTVKWNVALIKQKQMSLIVKLTIVQHIKLS